ncbi:MAG TPA: DUF1036 domain-containing protein [Candidatus Eremiobacteraceae bacterium]
MFKQLGLITVGAAFLLISSALHPSPALASFRVCNDSGEKISVAIAYFGSDAEGWTSEGWWNLDDGECATPVSGDLDNRYYYLFADGEKNKWTGDYTNCVDPDHSFTLKHADSDCNFAKKSFFKVDTGTTATDFTYTFK